MRRMIRWLPLAILVVPGCSQLQNKQDGTLDMDKVERLAKVAQDSGANVELDVVLRPGSAGIFNGATWDTGIEVTGHFRWTGKGEDNVQPLLP